MEQITFLTSILSFLFLLLISCGVFLFSKKINVPYTVLLFIVGLFLVPLSNLEFFYFIDHFKLTPDILFFVFLPVLLFEASYKIEYRKIIDDWRAIGVLAVFGVALSAVIVGAGLYFVFGLIGFPVPFLVTLLFGIIISATDPVAVLSIFQSVGAPKRLALLFEGESLFNDGTAVALFFVVLGIILSGDSVTAFTLANGLSAFLTMMIGGALFGLVFGLVFAKVIGKIKNNEEIEIILTVVLAHLTFVSAELITHYFRHTLHIESIGVSGVVATVIAGIIMGNYGKYKITPKVEKHVIQFWEFMAFVSNSLVFILIGLILSDIDSMNFSIFIIPVFCAIFIVIFARAISVYLPVGALNFLGWGEKIPMSWQHALSWGSLRGALALMMVLLIPGKGQEGYEQIFAFQEFVGWNYDFGIKDLILVLVIGCVIFTLIIKATTIPLLMRKTKITKLNDFEQFEYYEGNIMMLMKALSKLESMYKKGIIIKKEYKLLRKKYADKFEGVIANFEKFLDKNSIDSDSLTKRAINLHSLGAEKQFLKELFIGNEIGDKNFRYILRKIEQQIKRLSGGKSQLRKVIKGDNDYDIFQKLAIWSYSEKDSPADVFIRNRARMIITKRVVEELEGLSIHGLGFKKSLFSDVISFYEKLHDHAKKKLDHVVSNYESTTTELDTKLAEKSIFSLEESMLETMYSKGIISEKLYHAFRDEIQKDFYADVKCDLSVEKRRMFKKHKMKHK